MSGTVQGVGELQVTVNGIPAVVSGGFYQASIRLDEGENLLVVEAADARGETARQELSVILDTKPPAVVDLLPPAGSLIARAEIEVTGKVIDESPAWVYINGQAAVVETGAFRGLATLPDGTSRVTIHAKTRRVILPTSTLKRSLLTPRRRFSLPSRSIRRAGPTTTSRY